MFIIKNNYYLYIENTNSIDLNFIRKSNKVSIIYRNNSLQENFTRFYNFRKKCKVMGFKFYIANNFKLAIKSKADGLYLSSHNKKIYFCKKIKLIGSAHNYREIYQKIKQGCDTIILSRLFKTTYEYKKSYFGLIKFNLLINTYSKDIIPLGGIKNTNLLKLNLVKSDGLAIFSELKKKPVISHRLF